jgi:hypothetical protein
VINVVFPEIGTKTAEDGLQKGLKNLILHMSSALRHNSRQMRMEIQKLRLARILEPPYSPYFAMQLLTLRFRERGIERQ